MKRKAISVVAIQILAAAGQIAGIRVLTGALSGPDFGQLVMWQGVISLLCASIAQPAAHAIIRFAPLEAAAQRSFLVYGLGLAYVKQRMPILVAAPIVTGIVMMDPIPALAVMITVHQDSIKLLRLALIAGENRLTYHCLIQAADAWMRPMVTLAVLRGFGGDLSNALVGMSLASLIANASAGRPATAAGYHRNHNGITYEVFARYARPLTPLALISWTANTSDRYIAALYFGPAVAGGYASISGIFSRPLLMMHGALESATRYPMQVACDTKNQSAVRSIMTKLTACYIIAGAIWTLTAYMLGPQLIAWVTSNKYTHMADAAWPIAIGFTSLAVSYQFTRLCYATGATRTVTCIEAFGAIAGLASSLLLFTMSGVPSIGFNVALGFGCQLVVALLLTSRKWSHYLGRTE